MFVRQQAINSYNNVWTGCCLTTSQDRMKKKKKKKKKKTDRVYSKSLLPFEPTVAT